MKPPTDEQVASIPCPLCYKGVNIACLLLPEAVPGEGPVPQFHTERTRAYVEHHSEPGPG